MRIIILILILYPLILVADAIDDVGTRSWSLISQPLSGNAPSPECNHDIGGGTGDAGILAYSGGTYDSDAKMFIIWGGGHDDYDGNEIHGFDLDSSSVNYLTWVTVEQRSTCTVIAESDGSALDFLSDGRANSRHTYSGLCYNTVDNRIMCVGGSPWSVGGCPSYAVAYDTDTDSWINLNDPTYAGCSGAAVWDSNDNLVYSFSTPSSWIQVESFNPSTGNWSTEDTFTKTNSGDINAVYVPTYDVTLVISGSFHVWNNLTDSWANGSLSGDTGILGGSLGVAYDSGHDQVVIWGGGTSVYVLTTSDGVAWTSTEVTALSGDPGNEAANGTYGRWQYVPDRDVFVQVSDTEDGVWIYRLSDPTGTNSGSILQTVYLTPDTTDTCAFTIGLGFKDGDTYGPTLDIDNYQLTIKKYWNSGYVKHAIASGYISGTANTPDTINVYSGGSQPTGTDLAESDIVTAAPTAYVGISGRDTVSLSDLLGSPVRTWITDKEMVEAHYLSTVDDTLSVEFHVRLYSTNDIWIRAVVNNGILAFTTNNNDITYDAFIKIGSDTVFNQASLTHYNNTRYCYEGWIGNDPDIMIAQDCDYLESSGLVPSYWKTTSETTLNGLDTVYTINDNEGWTTSMGAAGFQNQIGILPLWDAAYVASDGDRRAFKSVIVNAKALNHYPIIWAQSTTRNPIDVGDYSNWNLGGQGAGGATDYTTGVLTWDVAHHGSGGYLAYLITGDYYYLQTMQYQSTMCWLVTSSGYGSGVNRRLIPVQTRGVAWAERTVGQFVAISPSDSVSDDIGAVLDTTINYWTAVIGQEGINQLGYFHDYSANSPNFAYGAGETSAWMQHFWMQTHGYLYDCEPLSDMSNFKTVRDWHYKGVVGLLGGNSVDEYCFEDASSYTVVISAVDDVTDPTVWLDSWGVVYDSTHGGQNTDCGNTMNGTLSSTSYWANLLPAISYAVEDTANGAYDAWARLIGATNWSTFENSGFDDTPIWGIYPRATPQTAETIATNGPKMSPGNYKIKLGNAKAW